MHILVIDKLEMNNNCTPEHFEETRLGNISATVTPSGEAGNEVKK